jgi:F420-dependent oxidoreductase-like protein
LYSTLLDSQEQTEKELCVDIAIMIEGQMGLTWERWRRIATAVEDLGFAGLYRSDHFTNAEGDPDQSLELWVSLTWLASHTSRIDFGPMVTPMSFRDPVFTARMGMQVDDLSNGRLSLGLGAGWQDREHEMFGYDLLSVAERFARFEEGLEVVSKLLYSDEPTSFDGEYYSLKEAVLLPRPKRRTPILIGGNGLKRTLPLAARFADEWNAVFQPIKAFNERDERLRELLAEQGRRNEDVRRSMMTGLAFASDQQALNKKLQGRDPQELKDLGLIVGTPSDVQEQISRLREETNLQRVMLQWFELDNLDGLAAFAKAVL